MNDDFFNEDEFDIYPIKDLLEGWNFRISEISMGAYRIEGVDSAGRSVSRVGSEAELDNVLKACVKDAQEISQYKKNTTES